MTTTLTDDDAGTADAKSRAEGRNLCHDALAPASRNGVPVLPVQTDAAPVTMELVNRLRDEWV